MPDMPMPHEREIITLVFGAMTFVFLMVYRREIKHVAHFNLLVYAFCLICLGWTSTVLDNLILYHVLDLVEHASYALGMVGLALWAWKVSAHPEAGQ